MAINIKGITVKQPYAQLLAIGAKHYETRSKPTKYRGPIAIHAGQNRDIVKQYTRDFKEWHSEHILDDLPFIPEFNFAYHVALALGSAHPYQMNPHASKVTYQHGTDFFPFGSIIAYAFLRDCYPVEEIKNLTETERLFGDWSEGRYAWEITSVVMLESPIAYKGQLGLWNVSDDAVRLITQSERR